jgi:hypothetical protein
MFQPFEAIWNDAVARNTEALKAILASLLAMMATYGGTDARQLPRSIRFYILQVLRPAESALRRLIVIAARSVKPAPQFSRSTAPPSKQRKSRHRTSNLSFQLFDPRKRFGQRHITYASFVPRVYFITPDPPFSPLAAHPGQTSAQAMSSPCPEPENQISARRLCLRLKALATALEDVPHQALRLARLQARRAAGKSMIAPLRPGRPPGHRSTPRHGIDFILADCHKFAMGVLAETPLVSAPNTS